MKKYVNSGKFNIGPVLLWTLIGLIAGAVVGIAYTFIAYFDPIIYLNLLVLMGVAAALTWVVVFIVKRSKSRNKAVNLTVTFLICLFSWYAGWAALMAYQFEVGFFWWLGHPGMLYEAANIYAESIGWTLNNSEIPAGMLKVFYVIEFLAFFAPMILVATKKLYYCEFCEGFMKPKNHYFTETDLVTEHLDHIKTGDLTFMEKAGMKLDKSSAEVPEQYKLNLHTCPGCQEKIYNFYHVKMKLKKGKYESDKTTTLVENTYVVRSES